MAIDLKINFSEIDPNDVGSWPVGLKAAVIVLVCVGVLFGGYYFHTSEQLINLKNEEKKEQELRNVFKLKQNKAVNLPLYKEQMVEMEESFGAMLRQLPSKTEVADLLVDVSQKGLANGLEFDLFRPKEEVPEEFYAELPIEIKVKGSYHEFGQFVSDIAALPRIVTIRDISITPSSKSKSRRGLSSGRTLTMKATAKTFRYLEEDEEGS